MKVERSIIGRTRGHRAQGASQVDGYTLYPGNDFMVTVWTYGATLVEVMVPERRLGTRT